MDNPTLPAAPKAAAPAVVKFRKHQHVTYDCRGRTITAIIRRAHRDGTVTVEARHVLDDSGNIQGCYLGFRFRYDAADLRASAS